MVMHRPRPAAALVAISYMFSLAVANAGTTEALARARALLARDDAKGAVTVLERALPGDPAGRVELLALLRESYATAAKLAEAAGDSQAAELYRDNLEILNHKAGAKSAPPSRPAPAPAEAPAPKPEPSSAPAVASTDPEPPAAVSPLPPVPEPPAAVAALPPASGMPAPVEGGVPEPEHATRPSEEPSPAPSEVPAPLRDPSVAPASDPIADTPADRPESGVRTASLPSDEQPPASAPSKPAQPAGTSTSPGTGSTIMDADKAFREKRYAEAGRIYAALDRQNRLPKVRRDHWAYCRWVEVVRRMNAKPSTPQEWATIDAEIQSIRALSPRNWFGEYLRRRAAERSPGGTAARSNQVVVRGSAPDEPNVGAPSRSATAASRPAPAQPPADKATGEVPDVVRNQGLVGNWQIQQTTNFRILHADPALAARVAEVAEAARDSHLKRWAGADSKVVWSPRCDIYIYPDAKAFSRMTGQPEQSPGFSTMGMNSGRIIARRVNLRADHPNLLRAILPHEITHVVLADLFPNQQIPRWADEGMAVLSEPASEQRLRAADLEKPLATGRLFRVADLMVMDYPDGEHWALYYAQSVSLTRYLVNQGSPAQFIQFVQAAQKTGFEDELRRIYKIEGFSDLQKRWLTYARDKSSQEATVAATPADSTSSTSR